MEPERIAAGQAKVARLVSELRRVILGKEQAIDEIVAALLARGHVLLEGLPGLGKTELVKALSRLLSLDFRRIQFTPDLLPTDITGSHILQERDGRKEFVFHPGPVFTNVLLADEINRASPKTQAALLEAMQEHRVTTFGETRRLPDPFFVLATQNPIELEGTYPLPEAQLDRFMFKVEIAGVERSVLEEILVTRVHGEPPPLEAVLDATRAGRPLLAGGCDLSAPRRRQLHREDRRGHASVHRRVSRVGAHVRQARQLAARRDRHRRRLEGPGAPARQTPRRLRRRAADCRAGHCASAGARLLGEARRMGRQTRGRGAARSSPRDRARTAADAGSEVNVAGTSPTWLGRNWPGAWVCAVIVFACPTVGRAAGEYRTFEVESLKIEFDSEWAMQTSPGYLPVRVDITNLGNARVIEIVGQGTRFFRSGRSMAGGATEVSQSVRLARGDRVRLTIPVPVFGTNENIRFEIRENGKTLERLNYTGFQSASAPAAASALIVADRASATGAMMGSWLRSIGGPAGPSPSRDAPLEPR